MGQDHSGDELVAAFARWAADRRASTAAQDRARERWLRVQAATEATWTGLVLDLAEQRAAVTVIVASHQRSGQLIGVGRDFCVLQQPHGRPAVIPLRALLALLPDGDTSGVGVGVPAGNREPELALGLTEAFEALAAERSPVSLMLKGGQQIEGDVLAVGEDVLTLQTAPPGRRLVYVPFAAAVWCELR